MINNHMFLIKPTKLRRSCQAWVLSFRAYEYGLGPWGFGPQAMLF